MNYDWPGNVRELRNVLEGAINDRMSGVLTGEMVQKDRADGVRAKSGQMA